MGAAQIPSPHELRAARRTFVRRRSGVSASAPPDGVHDAPFRSAVQSHGQEQQRLAAGWASMEGDERIRLRRPSLAGVGWRGSVARKPRTAARSGPASRRRWMRPLRWTPLLTRTKRSCVQAPDMQQPSPTRPHPGSARSQSQLRVESGLIGLADPVQHAGGGPAFGSTSNSTDVALTGPERVYFADHDQGEVVVRREQRCSQTEPHVERAVWFAERRS